MVPHECLPGLRLCSAPSLVLLLMGFFRCRPACCKEGMGGLVCGSVPCPAVPGVPARPGTTVQWLWMGYRACGQREGLTMLPLSACDASPA